MESIPSIMQCNAMQCNATPEPETEPEPSRRLLFPRGSRFSVVAVATAVFGGQQPRVRDAKQRLGSSGIPDDKAENLGLLFLFFVSRAAGTHA